MIGNVLLGLTLASSIAAIISERRLRWAATVGALTTAAASLYLWQAIFADDFSIAYVANYSARSLPTVYKISAFWAGQQGSFLLWLLFHSMAGLILLRSTDRLPLAVYSFLQSTLTILVLAKSPFEPSDVTPLDGFGLNPLLQDFWMAIHPPIIFLGYALLAVPISLSVGALLKNPRGGGH